MKQEPNIGVFLSLSDFFQEQLLCITRTEFWCIVFQNLLLTGARKIILLENSQEKVHRKSSFLEMFPSTEKWPGKNLQLYFK